jgi:TPR repeat protein
MIIIMKYKKKLLPLTLIITLGSALTPLYADFNDGWTSYINGDFRTATKEWKPLAEKGDAKSQTNLGILYFNGKGVLKDYKEAVSWLKKAAEQGEAEAQYILGQIYIDGDGVSKSLKAAKYWVQLAYENNFEGAKELWDEYQLWKY